MPAGGKLEKMLILAYESAKDAEDGGLAEAKERFEALINPETYTLEYKVKTSDAQGQGTSGAQPKFEYTLPEELTFDFLFDNTGLIDGNPKPDGIFEEVDAFRRILTEYRGASHEPYHLKLVWETSWSRAGPSRSASPTSSSTPTANRSGRWSGSSSRARSRSRSGPRWSSVNRPTSPTSAP